MTQTATPDPMDTDYAKGLTESLEAWTDHRFITAEQIEALALFSLYIVNLADHGGWLYCGHSYKAAVGMSILTVKAMVSDEPMICFTSGRTFLNCVKIFVRKVRGDMVEWRPDRYR